MKWIKRKYLTLWFSIYILTEYGERVTPANISWVWSRAERHVNEIYL